MKEDAASPTSSTETAVKQVWQAMRGRKIDLLQVRISDEVAYEWKRGVTPSVASCLKKPNEVGWGPSRLWDDDEWPSWEVSPDFGDSVDEEDEDDA